MTRSATAPEDEEKRLSTLADYKLVDTPPEAEFDHIVRLASQLFRAPIALVSLVARDRQFFKARIGISACETSRDVSFCAHALGYDRRILVVPDATQDARFAENALVTGDPHIRFYAGAPLTTPSGHTLGTLCLIDTVPRPALTVVEEALLADLAVLVMDRIEMRRQQALKDAGQQRFERMTATSSSAIICADAGGSVTTWNGAAAAMFGYEAAEAIGRGLQIIIPKRLRAAHTAGMRRLAEGGAPRMAGRAVELVALRRDGSEFPVEVALSTWPEADGMGCGAIIRDISDRRENEERLYRLAHYDQLTELPNRVLFRHRIEAVTTSGAPATILLLDLDGFKHVNDSLGHSAGDELLRAAAQRLCACAQDTGNVSRLGGDEFAVLLPNYGDPLAAANLANQIIEAVSEPFVIATHTVRVSASIGIAICPAHGNDAEELLANADLALYRAKGDGRRGFRFFEPTLRRQAQARQSLEGELHRAFANGEFELFYQPQVRLEDGAVVGVEALIRWRHPERGLLSPGVFLPVLEGSSLAAPVGAWTIATACAQAGAFRRAGLPDLRIGVNLFAAQFRAGDLVPTVLRVLKETDLPPHMLELEITENIILDQDEVLIPPLRELRAIGVGIAFDDYGTGYASLSLLKRYPLSRLKIDRSFVRDLMGDPDDAAIVKAVLALARSLNLDVIAEGIEVPEQEAFLKQHCCPEGQGYLFGKPMPASALAGRLSQRSAAA